MSPFLAESLGSHPVQRSRRVASLRSTPVVHVKGHTGFSMSLLRSQISWIKNRSIPSLQRPRQQELAKFPALNRAILPDMLSGGCGLSISSTRLLQIDAWIAHDLSGYIDAKLQDDSCDKLAEVKKIGKMMECYHETTAKHYANRPEAMSLALMSLLELWIAFDRTLLHCCPLLEQFHPGISSDVVHNLLLPELGHFRRLNRIEEYLDRRKKSKYRSVPLSDNFGRPDSFAVVYFETSPHLHQELDAATKKQKECRADKEMEWHRLRMNCEHLNGQYEEASHSEKCLSVRNRTEDSTDDCVKCKLAAEKATLKINVWEDFLSSDTNEQKAFIAELHMSPAVHAWRNMTLFLITNVLFAPRHQSRQDGSGKDNPQDSLRWLWADRNRISSPKISAVLPRVQLVSPEKAFSRTHYSRISVSQATSIEQVCVPSGCTYSYWNHTSAASLSSVILEALNERMDSTFANLIRRLWPDSLLGQYVSGTSHTSNMVISKQSECPPGIDFANFQAYGHLRAGQNLQWPNILVQLHSLTIDLGSVHTSLVLAQTAWEAGLPSLKQQRAAHRLLGDNQFGDALLSGLQLVRSRTKKTRESANTLFVVLTLLSRLGPCTRQPVRTRAWKLMRQLRIVSYTSARDVFKRVQENQPSSSSQELAETALMFSLVCHGTFFPCNLNVLSEEDAYTLFSVMVMHCEGAEIASETENPLVKLLMHRCLRFSVENRNSLWSIVTRANSRSLDRVVRETLGSTLHRSGDWELYHNLVHAIFESPASNTVIFDVFSRGLLLDGRTLISLPTAYSSHDDYKTLFWRPCTQIRHVRSRGNALENGLSWLGDPSCHAILLPEGIGCSCDQRS